MRKFITSAMAAVVTAGAVLAAAGPASAERRHYRHRDNDNEVAAAILGGVAGLALGAALSNGSRDRGYYDRRYYDRGGYGRSYSYDPRYDRYYRGQPRAYGYYDRPYGGYRTCVTRDRVWDPYIGRRVTIERRYAC